MRLPLVAVPPLLASPIVTPANGVTGASKVVAVVCVPVIVGTTAASLSTTVVALLLALVPGGGWVLLTVLQAFLVFVLVTWFAPAFAAHRSRRHVRRWWQSQGYYQPWGWRGWYI